MMLYNLEGKAAAMAATAATASGNKSAPPAARRRTKGVEGNYLFLFQHYENRLGGVGVSLALFDHGMPHGLSEHI